MTLESREPELARNSCIAVWTSIQYRDLQYLENAHGSLAVVIGSSI